MKATILVTFFIFATQVYADDFRSSSWGDSPQQVKASEPNKPVLEDAKTLIYKTTIAGINVAALYDFMDGQLYRGAYINESNHYNKNKYIDDFNKLKKLLTKKYGEPESDETTWTNDLYKNTPSDWGTAISIGHLIYKARWQSGNTKIGLALTGGKFKISNGIVYKDAKNQDKYEQQKEAEVLEQL